MGKRLNYSEEDMEKMFNERGYALIDKTYVKSHTNYRYICNTHSEFGVQSIALNSLKKGSGCRECSNEKKRNKRIRYTIGDVTEIFNKKGLVLIEGQEYHNNRQKLLYLCPNHIEIGEQETTLNRLQTKVVDGCSKCSTESATNLRKKDFKLLVEEVEEIGYRILSDSNEYVNASSVLRFYCLKHGEFQMSTMNLLNRKRCHECGMELNRGENHYNWNGGISSVRKWLRELIGGWKRESFRVANNRCSLTESKNSLVVHHLYGFDQIVKNVFVMLNIDIRENVFDYSKEERNTIKEAFISEHNKTVSGVVLQSDIHKLFHSLYGYGKNSPSQYEEFSIRYKLGEFDCMLHSELQARNVYSDVSFLFDLERRIS